MSKPKILLQLDSDAQASVFDGVVAVDAGIDHLFTRSAVTPQNVRELVFGTIFTRGPDDLEHTAIFVGGSNVAAGDALVEAIAEVFFGPFRVSVMVDCNGANTTAAAAVLAAAEHRKLADTTALVLGGTGPVGQRVMRLLAAQGARVRVASRELGRAKQVIESNKKHVSTGQIEPVQISNSKEAVAALADVEVAIAAGAVGSQLLPADVRREAKSLRVAIDLNAVPPLGIEGIEATDRAKQRDDCICYGALGVGRTKMKIHKRAVKKLFEKNDLILDAEQIFDIGLDIE